VVKNHAKRPRSKKTSRHRRNKSLQDANPSQAEPPSGKHFGAPLSLKKSVEDLTAEAPLQNGFVGPKLDIAKALLVGNNGPSQVESAPATPCTTSNLEKGPIVGVSWHKNNGLGPDFTVPRRSRTDSNRDNRRRSDITGMCTPEPIKNGYKSGSPGHTPGKPELLYRNRKNFRPLSYHVFPEVESQSKPLNGSCKTVPTSLHSPLFTKNYKEVIV